MICPYCEEEGKKSKVFPSSGGQMTLCGYQDYYDEEGRLHHHDPNSTTFSYRCSENHAWVETSYNNCWCGWKGGSDAIRKVDLDSDFGHFA